MTAFPVKLKHLLLVFVSLVILIATGAPALYALYSHWNSSVQVLSEYGKALSDDISPAASDLIKAKDHVSLQQITDRFSLKPHVLSITITDPEGAIIADSPQQRMGGHDKTLTSDPLPYDSWASIRKLLTEKKLEIVSPVRANGNPIARLRITLSLRVLLNNLSHTLIRLLTISFTCWLLVLFTLILLYRSVFSPARKIMEAAKRITKGDGSQAATVDKDMDEFEACANALNSMMDTLKKRQDERRESENSIKSIFESIKEGIYSATVEGKFLEVNQAMVDIFGYDSREEMLEVDIAEALYPAPAERSAMLEKIRQHGFIKDHELELKRKDNTFVPTSFTLNAVRDQNGNTIRLNGIIRDITEKKRLESQVRQAQKMEAIGTLAGGIAHDFNNILGAILGYTDLALLNLPPGSTEHEYLQQVRKSGHRAKDLIKQILAFSRQGEMKRTPIQINHIIKESLKLLRSSLPTTIEIRQNISPETNKILADPTRIHQVLMNLCTNASEAMSSKGGILEIVLTEVTLPSPEHGQPPDLSPGPYLMLSVSDTGHGMTEQVMERIFDPFFSTSARGEGSGMGLSVVHGIVKNHHGAITVHSNPGSGATFRIFFPIIDTNQHADETFIVKAPPGGNERILLVDDEETLANMGERMLQYLGYTVVATTSSQEALQIFQAQPDGFDVIITDQTMPEMTGAELAQKILLLRPDIPIILCTGHSETVSEELCEKLNIRMFLMKPITISEYAGKIRIALGENPDRTAAAGTK